MRLNSFSLKIALAATVLFTSFSPSFAQITREQNNEATRLNNQAIQLGQEGRHEEALELLNRSIAIGENQLRLYNRSFAFYRLKRYDEALKDINKALLRNTDNPKALLQRATIYSAQKNYTAAFEDLTLALTLEPDNIQTAMRRSATAANAKKYVQALDSYYYTEALMQSQTSKAPAIEAARKSIPREVLDIYSLLSLPPSSFMVKETTFDTNNSKAIDFTPKATELRFDGICSSINHKTGVISFDTLTVSFPNGKTKVLPEPKNKVATVSGVKIQRGTTNDKSGQIKVGDFIVIVGKDNGKIITPRAVAVGVVSFQQP